jgi:hypothetical protein
MSRIVLTSDVIVAGIKIPKGAILEVTAAQLTAIGAGNTRATATTSAHDMQGEAVGVSNGS